MKRNLLLFVLAACGAELSAEPLDISAAPVRMELPEFVPERFLPNDGRAGVSAIYLFGWPTGVTGPYEAASSPPSVGMDTIRLQLQIRARTTWQPPPARFRHSASDGKSWPNLDAPGPGYRAQLQRLFGP